MAHRLYHVTTPEKAEAILAGGFTGRDFERFGVGLELDPADPIPGSKPKAYIEVALDLSDEELMPLEIVGDDDEDGDYVDTHLPGEPTGEWFVPAAVVNAHGAVRRVAFEDIPIRKPTGNTGFFASESGREYIATQVPPAPAHPPWRVPGKWYWHSRFMVTDVARAIALEGVPPWYTPHDTADLAKEAAFRWEREERQMMADARAREDAEQRGRLEMGRMLRERAKVAPPAPETQALIDLMFPAPAEE